MEEGISVKQKQGAPTFLIGDRISGHPDLETVIEGDAVFRKAGTVIHADRLEYDQSTDIAKAEGKVRVNRGGNVYEGTHLELKVEAFEGTFENPVYQFLQNDAHGQASKATFLDESHTVVSAATYTTCRRIPGPDWMPAWVLRATTISIDNDEDIGIAQGAVLDFQGVPILPIPALSFPLSDKRKSGFLPPTLALDIGATSANGTELAVPYYWSIAPNRDATITPNLMTKRGVDLGAEFRYLESTYSGTVRGNYMPSDTLRNADRWGLNVNHTASIQTDLAYAANLGLTVDVNRVSDDNYWRDFTRASGVFTQRLLPSTVSTTWSSGGFSNTIQVQKWQTLQDVTAPITPPYDRVPQLNTRFSKANVNGFDWSVEGDYTQFDADRTRTLQPNTQRLYTLVQLSRPWLAPAGFFVPKVQLHAANYQFDAPTKTGAIYESSVVPTFSLDTGLVFERETAVWGRGFTQTLEPRAFYVNTPYRNQSMLPNYDTAANDFNFASIYTENAFVGHDKISDNNMLTLGLTTRFLDSDTGAQISRFLVAQRLRFDEQKVTLNPSSAPAAAGQSDILLGASVNVADRWAVDSTVQYNPLTDQSARSTLGTRYSPSDYRVVNFAYRFQRQVSEQVAVSWQWPLNDLWGDQGRDMGPGRGQGEGRYYGVGRMDYSLDERRLVNTVLGVEYDAGCWLGRVVLERVQTSTETASQRLMFQLEFVGFTKLGISPQRALSSNISRYKNLREAGTSNSRFSTYD
nr:LPS assembly protein LptD [Rhodoferax aquaticus]